MLPLLGFMVELTVALGPGGAFTNSNAAAAAFDAATTSSIITFEGATLPNVAPVVFVTGAGNVGGGIQTVDQHTPEQLGFNTTVGGNTWLQLFPNFNSATGASWTFNFTTPISAFGAYLTHPE
jgi:hypothetical protein